MPAFPLFFYPCFLPLLLGVERMAVVKMPGTGWIQGIAWSPTSDSLLMTGSNKESQQCRADNGKRLPRAPNATAWWMAEAGRTRSFHCRSVIVDRPASHFWPRSSLFPLLQRFRQKPLRVIDTSTNGSRALAFQNGKKPLLVVYDETQRKLIYSLPWQSTRLGTAALSPNGNFLVLLDKQKARIVDISSGKSRSFFISFKSTLPNRAYLTYWLPDPSRIAIVGDQGQIVVINAGNGRLVSEIFQGLWNMVEAPPVVDMAFSPDGRTMVTGGYFGSLSMWEVATGRLVRQFRGNGIQISPDNRTVAVLRDNALSVYDLYSGKALFELQGKNGFGQYFTFSPNGKYLAVTCSDSAVEIWNLSGVRKRKPFKLDADALWKDLKAEKTSNKKVEAWKKKPGISWKDVEPGAASAAYEAIGKLIASPKQAIALLTARFPKPKSVNPKQMQLWLNDLSHRRFFRRKAASEAIRSIGEQAIAPLQAAMAQKPGLETRRRIEKLLEEMQEQRKALTPARNRAMAVLERIDHPEAQKLLKRLKNGIP